MARRADLREGVRKIRDAQLPVVLDTSGPALTAALDAQPTLVKPNLDELRASTPQIALAEDLEQEVRSRAEAVRALGASAVVCSLGKDGMIAITDRCAWHAALGPGVVVSGNPTGAGDAAVASPVAGTADPEVVSDLLPAVQITALGQPVQPERDAE